MVLAAGKANQPGLATVTGSGSWGMTASCLVVPVAELPGWS
jgi:hypothetical protein